MNFQAVLLSVQNGAESKHKIKLFMEKGIVDLLSELGDDEFKEAQRSLIWSQTGSDARMHIENAATMFRLARTKYMSAISSTTRWQQICEAFIGGAKSTSPLDYPRMINYKKACVSSIFTAICYGYLKETKAMQDSLNDARQLFEAYRATSTSEIASVLLENTEGFTRQLEQDCKLFAAVIERIESLNLKNRLT
ncbi:hypothetical protein [Leptolyngbya sp. GGD]|uniref:hypothetical protein n=1 Tax=Leptolyngbya sp. GGD TaxID=2997907 RepID=UPI00227AA3A8|nr:hypothetical protein [Leptolyngbya sp. GGD]MCY6493812.1 hypothetical protein [Leptolyngbya sp. GGD]